MQETIRVLLCDDQAIIRVRVREALAQAPDIEVIGEAGGGLVGVAMAIGLAPDVVLMDVSMPDLNGIEATRRILDAAPRVRVLGFSAEGGRGTIEAMISAGARGYLLKHTDPEKLIRAIRLVMEKGTLKRAARRVLGRLPDGAERDHGQIAASEFARPVTRPSSGKRGSWSAEYSPDKDIVAATMSGPITDADAKAKAERVIRLLKENHVGRVLVDCGAAVPEFSYAGLYWLPRLYSKLGAPLSTRVAVVLPAAPHRVESFQFYALACRNVGYTVRLFETRLEAEDWLCPKTCV